MYIHIYNINTENTHIPVTYIQKDAQNEEPDAFLQISSTKIRSKISLIEHLSCSPPVTNTRGETTILMAKPLGRLLTNDYLCPVLVGLASELNIPSLVSRQFYA